MKRIGFIYDKITDIENIKEAHRMARKDKTFYREVKMVDSNPDYYLGEIQRLLKNKEYKVSKYRTQTINDTGKERLLMKLPYFPDRIIQWAIMLQLEKIFVKNLCFHVCASIPNRGIKRACVLMEKYLKDKTNTEYCLKMDVRKFYPSIDHEILKAKLERKIKDKDVLWLINTIIDSYPEPKGVPIGSYLSQYLANFYLSDLDHYIKEYLGAKYVIRYMDDIVILADKKATLHFYLVRIREYLKKENLELKGNYQIFPVDKRGVDFCGYRFFHNYTLLRKSTAKRFKAKLINAKNNIMNNYIFCCVNSYAGLIMRCDSYRLFEKYIQPVIPKLMDYYKVISKGSVIGYVNKLLSKKGRKLWLGDKATAMSLY